MKNKHPIFCWMGGQKGNSMLLATASAIAATMGIYFFVTLTSLSEDSKQRVSHLYNAYIMGQSIHNVISGHKENIDYFANGKQLSAFRHLLRLKEYYHNGEFVTLQTLVDDSVILDTLDPTATQRNGSDIKYDTQRTGARIRFLDADGQFINNSSTLVYDVALFVNLAGTPDATSNTPYADGDPFFYILMDPTEPNALGYERTVNIDTHPRGILSTEDGGIQAETSVVLPQDNE
ncbi:MAG: hypothetical protein ISQ13_03965 [Candidatus Margulisbacteria bacterium]|nr:hypothetical protein [Candidatus Margulisiibacteriota bacterium]